MTETEIEIDDSGVTALAPAAAAARPTAAAAAGTAGGAAKVEAVSISGLHKAFGGHPVLNGLDLAVPAGSITAVLGPSGSGKTTMLRVLAGFTQPDEGEIRIGGQVVDGPGRHVAPPARRIGYVPQEGSLFPHLTVAANVGFGLARSERKDRVAELLELIGLSDLGRRYPHQLSGGQQQRVALARALAPRPALVLLDEPFSSLDAALRVNVRREVVRILAEAGTTAILVTHDQDEAMSMAGLVAVIREGRIACCAPPRELYTLPADADLARFIGEANLLDGILTATGVDTALGVLPLAAPSALAPGARVQVLIRPEQLELSGAGTAKRTAEGTGAGPDVTKDDIVKDDDAEGAVAEVEYRGADARVSVELSLPGSLRLTARTAGDLAPLEGDRITLRVRGAVTVWPRTA